MTNTAQSAEHQQKPGTFSLGWLFGEIALIGITLACWRGVDWQQTGRPQPDIIFLPCGVAIACCTALGGLFGKHWIGMAVGLVAAAGWLGLLWLAAAQGAFE